MAGKGPDLVTALLINRRKTAINGWLLKYYDQLKNILIVTGSFVDGEYVRQPNPLQLLQHLQ